MAWAFLIVFIVAFIAAWTITYSIRRNCNDWYKRDLGIFSYWVHIEIGSNQKGCPGGQP
jgi:hypothetical protein